MILTRRDVASAAACVQACNDGGVHDELLAKLRGLFVLVRDAGDMALPEVSTPQKEGPMRGAGESPVGQSRVAADQDSAKAGERCGPAGDNPEAHAPETDNARKSGDAGSKPAAVSPADAGYPTMRELEYEPGAPDTVVLDETDVEALADPSARPSTVAAVREGVAAAERERLVEEPISHRRRRRRTRAVNE